MMNPELLYDTKTTRGEGPIWDARTQTLYWLDILNKRIYANGDLLVELDEAALQQYPLTGGVFRLETNVEGMPTFEFAG